MVRLPVTIAIFVLHTDIADSDVIYTKMLTGNGNYDMKNSKILILGMFMCCYGDTHVIF